jgi:hypothetical protein
MQAVNAGKAKATRAPIPVKSPSTAEASASSYSEYSNFAQQAAAPSNHAQQAAAPSANADVVTGIAGDAPIPQVPLAGKNPRGSHKSGATKNHDLASSGREDDVPLVSGDENELFVTQARAMKSEDALASSFRQDDVPLVSGDENELFLSQEAVMSDAKLRGVGEECLM